MRRRDSFGRTQICPFLCFPYPIIFSELLRRYAGLLPEGGNKIADIVEAAHVADALNFQIGAGNQQLLCLVDSGTGDIALCRAADESMEQSCEVL